MLRSWTGVAVGLSGWLLVGCGSSAPPDARAQAQASTTQPAAAPPSQAAPAGSAGGSGENVTLADIFPAGRGRDLVLNTCGSCHAVACAAQGRRTVARWGDLKTGHKDTVTGISSADYDALFAYLEEHFNDTTPEPRIPAKFLEQGCTPF